MAHQGIGASIRVPMLRLELLDGCENRLGRPFPPMHHVGFVPLPSPSAVGHSLDRPY